MHNHARSFHGRVIGIDFMTRVPIIIFLKNRFRFVICIVNYNNGKNILHLHKKYVNFSNPELFEKIIIQFNLDLFKIGVIIIPQILKIDKFLTFFK